ncbi:hypothetical protein [uncultured Aquitalea sp.]|uniref:hypothetical protein n=1 Tax=uncultured Aquitalea sp. TaxID=540272 RepID=UPI0025D86A4F|nr:hypothetical protein [uncultured Aquitalea sp.]
MLAVQIHSTAQRQAVNEVMLASALRLTSAIEQLVERGFTVIKVDFTPARPTITVRNDAHCHAMVESGDAVYYSFGKRDYFGPYKVGQFQCGGCRVIWVEFGC